MTPIALLVVLVVPMVVVEDKRCKCRDYRGAVCRGAAVRRVVMVLTVMEVIVVVGSVCAGCAY